MLLVPSFLLSLATTAPQESDPPTQAELQPRLDGAVERIERHNAWQRIDFDERWNDSGPTLAAMDGLANVKDPQARDVSYVSLPLYGFSDERVTGIAIEVMGPKEVPFLVTHLRVLASPTHSSPIPTRRVRIELPGADRQLRLAEVRLHGDGIWLSKVEASQSSAEGLAWSIGGHGVGRSSDDAQREVARRSARRALDGVTDAPRHLALACTGREANPWWEVDLGELKPMRSVELYGDPRDPASIDGFVVVFLDEDGAEVWRSAPAPAPHAALRRSVEVGPMAWQPLAVSSHSTMSFAPGCEVARALGSSPSRTSGWAPASNGDYARAVLQLPPYSLRSDSLRVELHQEHGGGRVVTRFGARVSSASELAAPVPAAVRRLSWNEPRAPWSVSERRQVARFLDVVENHFDLWTLSDVELLDRVRARIASDHPLPPELAHLEPGEVLALTPEDRVDLAHWLRTPR